MSDLETMRAVMKVWGNAQKPMAKVVRWGNFPDYGQTLLMHNNSVLVVAAWVCRVVEHDDASFRKGDVYEALIFHDHGEPLTGGDEHIDAQTKEKEVREYEAFQKLLIDIPIKTLSGWLTSFTLQFCRKTSAADLPSKGQIIVDALCGHAGKEALVFEFIERLDYVFTALDGFDRSVRNEREGMLEHCLKNQAQKLNGLVEELPILGEIWNNTLHDELHSLAAGH
jgi:hypothetical protein